MFLWIPLTFAFYAKFKQDRVGNSIYRGRIVTIHMVQLPFLIYAKLKNYRLLRDMEKKYMSGLSDYEIIHFETLFKQLRSQQTQPAPGFT